MSCGAGCGVEVMKNGVLFWTPLGPGIYSDRLCVLDTWFITTGSVRINSSKVER